MQCLSVLLLALVAHNPYPLDRELGGTCGTCGEKDCFQVQLKCFVTKQKDGKYLYTYKLKNKSKLKRMSVSWELLDRATYNGHNVPMWWKLKPQQEITITLVHEEAPVWYTGMTLIQMKASGSDKSWQDTYKEVGVKLPPGSFYYCNGFGQPGPLPPSFIKKK